MRIISEAGTVLAKGFYTVYEAEHYRNVQVRKALYADDATSVIVWKCATIET